jgi:hypothetical protein
MSLYPNSYFVKLAKNGESIQDGGPKFVFIITLEAVSIFNLFFTLGWC